MLLQYCKNYGHANKAICCCCCCCCCCIEISSENSSQLRQPSEIFASHRVGSRMEISRPPCFSSSRLALANFGYNLGADQEDRRPGDHNDSQQEPITRSLHLPYYSSEPTLSRIFLFLEAPPTEVFAGVFVITNHERAAVTHCLQVTGNQSYLHLHGLHDSKCKLIFLFTALFRSVSTDFNACKFVAGIVWCGGFIVTEKSLHKPYLAFKHTSLLDYKTWLSRHVFN